MQSGQIFGNYRVDKRLGSGGGGDVHLAWGLGNAKAVAIKTFFAGTAAEDIEAEIGLNARLVPHRNNVQVIEVVRDPEVGMVMEYLNGVTVHDVLVRGSKLQSHTFPEWEAFTNRIIAEAAHGLHHLHTAERISATGQLASLQAVHRDVSPSNIMITHDGRVVLMDFGAAHAFYTSRQRQTGPGAAPGKMSYLGPERAAGGLATPKSDQHSLGSVHLELLTLKSAFAVWVNSQLDHQATKARALSGVPIGGWDERTRGMRAELKTVVQTAMAKDPAHRHDSVADYRDALLKVAPAFDDAGVERMLARLFPEKVKGWKKLPAAPKKKWWKKLLGLLTVAVLLAPVVSLALPQQVEVITEAGETTHFVCPLGYHTSWTPPGDHIRGTCSKPSWVFAHCDTQTEYRGERSALIGPWKSTCVEENGRWTCRTSKPGAKHEQ